MYNCVPYWNSSVSLGEPDALGLGRPLFAAGAAEARVGAGLQHRVTRLVFSLARFNFLQSDISKYMSAVLLSTLLHDSSREYI